MSVKKQLYMDVAKVADVPLNKREKVSIGRGGVEKAPRCYHLKPSEMIRLKKEGQEKGRFISPYGPGRLYSFIIDSLVSLGVGAVHPLHLVFAKFKELSSADSTKDKNGRTLLQRFEDRLPRNEKTGLGVLGKFIQNIEVIQRLGGKHPYGLKLAQMGACINILVVKDAETKEETICVELKTGIPDGDMIRPYNMNRKRNYTKTVDEVQSGLIIQ